MAGSSIKTSPHVNLYVARSYVVYMILFPLIITAVSPFSDLSKINSKQKFKTTESKGGIGYDCLFRGITNNKAGRLPHRLSEL